MYSLINPVTAENLIELLHNIINGLIRLSIPVAVIMLIWAAVLYMTSMGSDKIKKATKALTWTVVGFAVLLISSGIIATVQDFLGAGLLCNASNPCPPLPHAPPEEQYICQDTDDDGNGICVIPGEGPTTFSEILTLLSSLSGWLFAFSLIGGAAMIIISGLSYVFSRGDTNQASKALKMLVYSVVGIAIAASAWAIINIVADFLTGKEIFGNLSGLTQLSAVQGKTEERSEAYYNIRRVSTAGFDEEMRQLRKPYLLSTMLAYTPPIPINEPPPPNAPIGGPQTLQELLEKLNELTGWMFAFVLIIAVGAIIYGGFTYLTSKGDAKSSETGSKIVIYAIIGVAIAGMAWAFVNVTGNLIFGETLIQGTPGYWSCQDSNGNEIAKYDNFPACNADPKCNQCVEKS